MEKYKKGGYTILDLESSTIYADSVKALDSNKPVVVYDTNKPYFADTIVLDGTNVVITKGGKTITIANDNTITNVGDIQNHLYDHNITLTISVTGDSKTDIYLTLKVINNTSDTMDLNAVKSYINRFNWGHDEVLNCNAFGEKTYVGITYDGEYVYKVLSDNSEYVVSDMSLYNDSVIQLF